MRSLDKELSQIFVSPSADAGQLLLASGGAFSRNRADPCGKSSAPFEGSPVADCRHRSRSRNRSDSGNRHQVLALFKFANDAIDQLVRLLDLSVQVLHLPPQLAEQHPQGARQLVIGIFQDSGERLFDMAAALRYGDAALQQHASNLVDHRSPAHHPPLAQSVQRRQVELVIALDGYKAHPGTGHSLSTGFGIDVVVLVGLHIWLYVLGRHQARIVPLLPQSSAQKMRASASLHADQARGKVRREAKQLSPRTLLANHNFSPCVNTYKVKHRLPQVDTDGANFHGTLPVSPLHPPGA